MKDENALEAATEMFKDGEPYCAVLAFLRGEIGLPDFEANEMALRAAVIARPIEPTSTQTSPARR